MSKSCPACHMAVQISPRPICLLGVGQKIFKRFLKFSPQLFYVEFKVFLLSILGKNQLKNRLSFLAERVIQLEMQSHYIYGKII